MAILFEDDARRAVQGSPTSLTISVPSITGSKGLIEVAVVFRNSFNPAAVTCTWKGDPLTAQSQANGDGGRLRTYIFAVSLGDGELGDGDVVVTPGTGDDSTALAARVTIYDQIDQANAIRFGTNVGTAPGSTGSNIALTMNALVAGDICVSVCHTGDDGNSIAPNQPTAVVWDPTGGGFIDAASGGVSRITATGTSQQMRWAWSFPTDRALAVIAWAGDTSTTPAITSVTGSRGAGKSVPPDDTDIAVLATDADVAGTTRVYLANDTDFGTATLEEQTFDGLTGTGLNWLEVTLGVFEEGPLFLFVVADADGTPVPSAAFPVIISAGEVLIAGRLVTLSGSESGPTVINTDLEFVPHAAWIRVNGNTVRGSFNPQAVNSICSVDDTRSMGVCCASDGTVAKRQQAIDVNTLIVLDPTTAGATEQVLGTPSLTDSGLDINFSASKQDIDLLIFFFGGNTFQSKIVKAVASDGVITGVPFKPEFGIFFSCNLTDGVAGDTAFSRMSLGVANAVAAGQQVNMVADSDGNTRNTVISSGAIVRQLSQTTVDYVLALTAFTDDGMTWSGGGGEEDAFYAHLFDLDGAGSFVNLWQKEGTGVDGLEELLPDSGLDDLRFIAQFNASRADTDTSPNIGYRWDTGAAGNIVQHSELNVHNPAGGPGTAEQGLSLGVWAQGTDSSSVITVEGEITAFERQSTVRWNINPPDAIQFGLFGWETLGDDKFITVPTDDSGLGFVGTVGTPEITPGTVTLTDDTVPAFGGIVPVPEVMFGTPIDLEQSDTQTFAGTVPIHRLIAGASDVDPAAPTFAGVVSQPAIPVPGVASITDAEPSFVGTVGQPSLAFSVHQVLQGVPGFAGTVPEPSLAMNVFQGPVSFVGAVGEPVIAPGALTVTQLALTFVGTVSTDHALTTGPAPAITQDPVTFVGTVPVQNVVHLIGQLDPSFVGTVLAPIVQADPAPAIEQEPATFVGVVSEEASVAMAITQPAVTFAGHVPEPFAVILRDPPGRRHLSLGLGA